MAKHSKKELSDEALELVAARFRILSEPMRLRLLNSLRAGERTVSQLVEETGAGQANVSKHLGILMEGGLVERRKEGLNAWYAIKDPMIFELCEMVCSRLQKEFEEKAARFS